MRDNTAATSFAESATRPLKIFVIAGEHSADLLGAKLMAALRGETSGRPVHFVGVGGAMMEAEGLASLYALSDIAVMGPLAIAKRLPGLVAKVYATVDAVLAAEPDLLLIIDAPEFTHPIAKRVRRRRPSIPIIDYVSPTVWAWRSGRARKMRPYVDHVLALFPFEPAAHARLSGPPCTYVGHPIIERLGFIAGLDPIGFGARHGLDLERPVIVVLPGSRRSEVERLMGVFGETVARVASHQLGLQVLIPAMATVKHLIAAELDKWPKGEWTSVVIAGEDEAEKFSAFKRARAALAASGTVTLELALTRTPMVVAYKVDAVISALRHLIKTRTSVLPNLITGEFGVPEFHQEACTPENLAEALEPLVRDTPERALQLEHLDKVPPRLALAEGTPSKAAARAVMAVLSERAGR